jgi:hypothetical protein
MVKILGRTSNGGTKSSKKITNLDQCNSSKWWKRLKSLTGQDIKQEWFHQFLEDNVDVKALANKINDMFLSVAENFSPLPQQNEKNPSPCGTSDYCTRCSIFNKEYQTFQVSRSIQLTKQGANGVAPQLSTVIQYIYNQSLI